MFGAGDTASQTIKVPTTHDTNIEPKKEKFILRLSGTYDGNSFEKEVLGTILENDRATVTMTVDPGFTVTEGQTVKLKFTLSQALPYQLLVRIHDMRHETATKKDGDGGATEADYTFPDSSFTELLIKANQISGTFDIPTVDDTVTEPNETVELEFNSFNRGIPGSRNTQATNYNRVDFSNNNSTSIKQTLTIQDNDSPTSGERVVHLQGGTGMTQVTLTEGGSTNIMATIVGDAPSSEIKIPLDISDYPSGEFAEKDYDIPKEITIKSGMKSGNVRLTTTNNSKDDRYHRLVAVEIDDMRLPSGYTSGDRNRFEVVITDNETTNVSLQSPSRTSLSEDFSKNTPNNLKVEFEIHMARPVTTPPPSGTAPFVFNVDEPQPKFVLGFNEPRRGKASHGVDYKVPSTISTGNCKKWDRQTCTVELTVIDDMLHEGNEEAVIRLTEVEDFNGFMTAGNFKLTIIDNDPQPMLSIGDATVTEGGKLSFTVTRDGAKENALSVKAATAPDEETGTHPATTGSDYSAIAKTLNFPKNKMMQTFKVTTTDDMIDEPDETFLVKLSEPKDTQGLPKPGIADDTATGTITDNDDAPTALTITVDTDTGTDDAQTTIAEAAGETDVTVTATITSPTRFSTEQMVTIAVGKEGDGAAEGTDYKNVPDNITITIPAEQASGMATFKLTPVNDRLDEDGETISVEGALTGMTVTHAVITIEDDDTRGITVEPVTLTLDEEDKAGTADKENQGTYEVVLTSEPTDTVTIKVASDDEKIAAVDKKSLMFTKTNWEMPQTVTVTSVNDPIDNTNDLRTTSITNTVSASETDYEDQTAEDVDVTVTDDDEAPTALTITVDKEKVGEGDKNPTVQVTATLDGDTQFATAKNITITVGDSDKDTATEGTGGDYDTVAEFDITLPSGESEVSHDLTLTLNDDSVDEPDEETISVTGELSGVTVKGTSFYIEDNDTTPTVTLVLTPASINESGTTNTSTVTATMDADSSEAVTLTVSATPVDPAVAGDLTLSENATLEIPAKSKASTGVVTITAVDNDVDAADKTVTVAATATGGNALVQAPGNQTLTIKDDDTRGITVSKATLTLDEADNAKTMTDEHQDTYTVVLDSEPSGGRVTIGVASGGTAVATVAPATLTFTTSNWNVPQTVTVTAMPDNIDNPNDRRTVAITHTVTATGTDYDGATASGVTVTVNDDDGAPTLSINSPSVTEVNSGETATLSFTVRLTPASGNTVTVAYADAGTGTATSGGTDYRTLTGGTLTFAPGDRSKSVAVTVNGDDIDEPDETVVVRLSSPSNATLTGGTTTLDGTGTINDNDATPTVSVANATAVSEGDVAAPDPPNNMTFTVTLSAVSGRTVTVPYTLGGTATAGTDYTEPDPRSVTISAGTRQANIEIPVAGDEVDEENETITVTLGTPTNATVSTAEGAGAASGTITDDDTRGVSVTPTALTVAEADNTGTADEREDQETYKVVLTSEPTGAVTVNLKSGDESVARIDTASLTFDADDWNTERTVTVTGQADVIDNTGDERATTIAHTVSAAGTDYADETAEGVAVTVTDDDAAPSGITLTANPDSVTENGGAKTITVTAAVNGATRYAQARTVSVSVGGGTAISGTDYTAVESFDITIGVGEDDASNTFTLTPDNDVLAEGNETIGVTGTLSGITITPDEITITDDDAAPSAITLSVDTNAGGDGTPTNVGEGATATTVRVTATITSTTRFATEQTVTVKVGKDGDSATEGTDYALVADQSIKIPIGAASGYVDFPLTPTHDVLDEMDETISVDGELTGVTFTPSTITINDDDAAPEFITLAVDTNAGGNGTPTSVGEEAGATTVRVTATITSATRFAANQAVTFEVGKSADTATESTDYTEVGTLTITIDGGEASGYVDFTLTPTSDVLDEPNETISVHGTQANITFTDATITITDDDAAPSGITLSVDTNGAEDGTPSTVAEDAGATVVTVTATVNGATRYVDAKTVAVSVDDNTAASPADYAAVSGFNITIAAGAASHTGSFTVTPVDDDLDESNETIDVTGTLTDITVTGATVTLTDTDDPVSFSIADAEATEGGKVTFTVSRGGAGDNVASVKIATAADSGDDVNAAGTDDYTAISPAQTLNFAKGVASQTVEVQTTQDDLFEPEETFRAVLSAPALADGDPGTGVSIESGKGTAIGTIKNDDTEPSFAVADASASEGDAITFTVTRSGAMDNAVSVKWNTKADSGAGAAATTDYTAMPTATKLDFAKGEDTQTFTVATTEDVLDEGNETFLVELTGAVGGTITTAEATGTINDDDAAPTGITLSVDTNGAEDGTPSTVAEDAGATVVTVTATVNGTTRYVDAKTVVVSVDDNTAASPADYAAVTNFNITIAAGAASQTGSFTVTPVDDDLDEANETIDVTGTLTGITIADATVTLTDTDAPVSFSIADAEATEGGKVTFTVSRGGAGDNVASVKIATAADSGDDVNAAGTDDYTAISPAQTLNFAKGVASQTVEVQTTQDDLFEPEETFRAVLSAPALADGDPGTGVSIESGKGTAIGTIKNDDTEPSFAVADASASEGDAITFTVTRSGAMDNAVSVKWNTKADSGAGAAATTDYTAMPTATKLDFAKGEDTQTFTVATTEDVLDEGNETFLVELTGAVGGTITTAEATGTINDDDAAPTGITLSVDTNGAEDGTPSTVAEDAGATVVTVTATVNGTTRYVDAKTVVVSVDDNTAASPADYAAVTNFNITIAAGAASQTGSFTVTPVDDDLDEANETIDVTGTLTGITIADATVTLTDTDAPVSFSIADAEATEGGKVTFTVSRKGAEDNVASVKVATAADSGDDVNAADADDYTAIATAQTLNFAKGVTSQTVEVQTTQDDLFEPDETFKAVLSAPALGEDDPGTGVSIETGKGTATGTITNDDAAPSGITLSVSPDTVGEEDGKTEITVTATVNGTTRYVDAKTVTVSVGGGTAISGTDYTAVTSFDITIAAGDASKDGTFDLTPTNEDLYEGNETIDVTGTSDSITITKATISLTDDDIQPSFAVADASAAEGEVITFTVTRSGAMDNAVSVKWNTKAATGAGAASATDYTESTTATKLDFAKGVGSQTFTVATTEDNLHEGDETFLVELTDAVGATITDAEATGTITDDDAAPSGITLSVSPDTVGEEDGKTEITVTATVNGTTRYVDAKTVTVSVGGGTAISGTDYTAVTSFDITIAAGDASKDGTFDLTPTNEDLYEGNETIDVTGTSDSITITKATISLTDDDIQPSFAVADASAAEGEVITFTVTRSGAMDNAVSVKWNTKAATGAGAASATDYTESTTATKLDFAKGVGSQTFTVATTEDNLHEGDETFLVELTDAVGATITDAEATGTITDDDAAPSGITLSVSPDTVGEEDGKTEITVTATVNGTTRYVDAKTVTVSVGGGTAISGTDYTAVTSFDITIAAGDASKDGTFDLTPTNEDLYEGNETIDVTGTSSSITVTKATISLTDDDIQPSFAVADASAAEGEVITFTVTRSGAMDNAVSVKWNTKAATVAGAASATDYTESTTATKLDFAKGVGSQTFTVATTEDTLHEGDETFLVELTDAVGATITDAEATGTITDDDAAPTMLRLTVDADTGTNNVQNSLAEDGGAKTVRVTATLVGNSTFTEAKTVTVDVGVDADSAEEGTDYATVAQQSITIDADKSSGYVDFTLTPTQDVLAEGSETISLDGTLTGLTVTDATITLTDDDTAPTGIRLSVSPATVGEGADDTEITVTATVNGTTRYAEDKTVTVSVGGGTATSATDYGAVENFDITIAAGDASKDGTFDLTPTDDDLHEGSETIDVTGTSSSITVTKATISLTDDDIQPSFAVADASAAEGEVITFTVTRSGAMDNAVSVKWNTKAATVAGAASATDYTESTTATKLDFAKGVGSQTFTVATTEDTLHEGDETFLVELTDAVGATITDAEATGTITDDDAAPTMLTLTVDADTGTNNVQNSLAEDGGAKTVRVTATLVGNSTFTEAKTVTVDVGVDADSAEEGTDYATVAQQSITIDADKSSGYVDFTLTPTQDVLAEGSETISLDGTLTGLTVTDATITLTDDDTAPTGIRLSVSPATVGEGADDTEITVTATVNGTTRYAEDKTVTVSVGGGTATSATDYGAVENFDITIAAGDASKDGTFDLTPTDDDLHEGSETIDVTGTSSSITVTKATISLTDDDIQPSFAVADASAAEGEVITFTVTRSGAMDNAVSVKWNTKAATVAGAASATDYTESTTATKLDFAKGVGSQTFTVATTEDTLHEGDETFLVELTDAVGATITDAEATGTITDDDAAPTMLRLTVDADTGTNNVQNSLAEDGGAKTVRVTATLVGNSTFTEAKTVTVDVGVDADSAEEGTDYATVAQQSITIDADKSSGYVDFTLTPTQDVLAEGSETISLDGTLTGLTVTDATITLTDDDTAPTGIRLSVSPATVGEGADDTEITVTATVNGTTRYAEDKTVTVSVGGGTATSATDYGAVENFDITIAAGDASKDGTFDLTPTDDDLHEGSETIDVTGTSSSITVTKATISLTDDDGQPSFAVADASAAEGEVITFTVTRSGAMDNAVSVKWNTKAATVAGAASATDYTESTTATKLDFAKGVGSQTFTVATTEDTLHEGDETFLVELTDAVGATITDAEATGTITDDDAAPTMLTLTVDADTGTNNVQNSLAEDGGAKTVRVTATLVGNSTFTEAKTVTVDVGVDADSAEEGTDYATVAQQSITIDADKSSGYVDFTLTPTQDVLAEGSETISLDGTLTGLTVTDATITLTDDDTAPTGIRLSVSPATVGEGADDTEITVTATVNGTTRYAEDKTVTVSVGGGTATSATDYGAVENFDITIAAGDASKDGTFDLTPTDDDLHEGSETIDVTGTSSSITVTKATISLTDDDGQPSFAVADASAAEGEVITFTVTRSGAMDNAVSVKWNTKAATVAGAASATDYTESTTATKLDFAKGVGSQTFTVATTEDTLHEGDETFLVELTDAVGATITDAEATGTITDDDAAPTMLTLTVDADTGTNNVQNSLAEDGGAKTVRVTATLVGNSTFTEAKTVTVDVGVDADSAEEGTDYATVAQQSITIDADKSSGYVDFTLTPTQDVLAEGSETISLDGTLTGLTVTDATITLTDDDTAPTGIRLSVSPATVGEGADDTEITVTATVNGTTRYAEDKTVTVSVEAQPPHRLRRRGELRYRG